MAVNLETIVSHIAMMAQDLNESGYTSTRFYGLAEYFRELGYLVDSSQITEKVTIYTIEMPYLANGAAACE